jgi:HlyD family secretion protein
MGNHSPRIWQKPRLWLILGASLLIGGGVFAFWRHGQEQRQIAAEQAALPPPRQVQVVALGRIEPAGRVVQVAAAEAGRLDRLLVRQGDQVDKGQILAYLDRYSVRQAERNYAASQLAEARAQRQAEIALGEAQVAEADSRLDQVDAPQQAAIAAQAAAIQSLQAQLAVAEIDLVRFQQLSQSGAVARQELDRQQATVDRLRADLDSATATRQRLETGRTTDLRQAQAQRRAAQVNAERNQLNSRIDSAAQSLALAEAQLGLTLIRAPQAGQVLDIYADPGEAVSPNDGPVLALGDTRQMVVVAEVYESDIGLVKLGQPATITSRNGAFSQTLTGKVAEIGLQIAKNDILDDDPAANADARVVEVRVELDQSQVVAGLTNLQVDVAIDIQAGG